MDPKPGKNWKLELRYGRLRTPFSHFTAIASGRAGDLAEGFTCRPGPAVMAIKLWAESADHAIALTRSIAVRHGFDASGRIQIYQTEPDEPPREHPHGYGISFHAYDEED